MNRKENSDIYSSFILVVVGVIFGYLCFAVAEYYTKWLALVVFLVNIAIVFMFYLSINQRYKQKMQNFIAELLGNVKRISDDETPLFVNQMPFAKESEELYRTIKQLNDTHRDQNITNSTVLNIINSIVLKNELGQLFDDILPKVIDGTGSNWGAIYLNNKHTEKMELKSSVGFSKNIYNEFDIPLGEGFIGRGALSDRIEVFNDIPEDTIYMTKTFLGKMKPKSVMIVPITSDNENVACLLLASIYDYEEPQVEIVNMIRYYLGSAISNGVAFEKTKRLKNELVFQNQLIQNMNEELEQKVDQRTNFLNGVLDSIIDYAIISMDAEGYITMWNKGAELMKGFKESEVVGKHILETYPDSDRDEPMKRLEIAKREGKSEEFSWRARKNGTHLYAHIIITAIYNDSGYLIGYTNVTRDITSLKSLEQQVTFLSHLLDLYLAEENSGLIIVNNEGCVLNISSRASEMLHLNGVDTKGFPFENLLLNSETYKKNLETALKDLTKISWKESVVIDGHILQVTILLNGRVVPVSMERFAVIYVEPV